MCGFVGYLNLAKEEIIDDNILLKMCDTVAHRGPDSSGFYLDNHVGLGFRRLSIIDLEGGSQPIYNEDSSVVLLCNGEIYNFIELRESLEKNHTFRTNSDVEVLIHLYEEYGTDFLTMLNGQFAFVIYDKKRNLLFLARDHFGINPLYYTVAQNTLVFASEVKAILQHPKVRAEVDLVGLDQLLSFPGLVSPRTIFKNVKSLENGHYLTVQDGNIKDFEYWDLTYPKIHEENYDKPDSYYIETLEDLLTQSVRYRLQADVPVGFYLSGGLDSSLIASIGTKISNNNMRQSFSIDFLDKEISESKYQRIVAKELGFSHNEITFNWHEIISRLSSMIYHCEAPVKETFNTCSMALSEFAKRLGVSVVLAGEGADELFAGYPGYRFDQLGLRNGSDYSFEDIFEEEIREKLWGDKHLFYEINQYEFQEVKLSLYSDALKETFQDFNCTENMSLNREKIIDRHPIHQRSYLDFKLRLSDHLLSEHGDRMALANSVEARYPFLDINLVEFSTKIPPGLKLNQYSEKYILKEIARKFLPDEIINREKFGFRAPGSPYLIQENVEWINSLLSFDKIKKQGYFDPHTVERLRKIYSEKDFTLHPHLETDLLMIVITFNILLDLFNLPDFS